MNELDLLKLHQKAVFSEVESRLACLRGALEELRRTAVLLFESENQADGSAAAWMNQEGFGFDSNGYFTALPRQTAYRKGTPGGDALSFYCPRQSATDPEACFQMYALRGVAPLLQELRSRMPRVEYLYFQGRKGIAVTHPYVDPDPIVPPDFSWNEYYTYKSVAPEVNPGREIRWAWPSDDVARQGAHGIVSIPVYLHDNFVGLWSIDVPLAYLCEPLQNSTVIHQQYDFVCDFSGRLIHHPSLGPRPNFADGCVYWSQISDLGGGFETMNPLDLAQEPLRSVTLRDGAGQELSVLYTVLPDVEWILFSAFPRTMASEVIASEVTSGLQRLATGDLSHRLETTDNPEFKTLVEEYNRMAERLEKIDKRRRKAERAQQECELRYGSFEDLSPVGIFRANTFGHYLHVNRRWSEISGLNEEEAEGRGWLDALHPDDRERVENAWRKAVTKHEPFWAEYRLRNASGEETWVLSEAVTIGNVRGEPIGYIGTATDITRQKRLQMEVVEAGSREQSRIGQDLHDNLGQLLTGASYMTHALAGRLKKRSFKEAEAAKEIVAVMRRAINVAKGIARGLAPMISGETDLKSALEDLATNSAAIFDVQCDLSFAAPWVCDENTVLQLYRITQESISNAVRHGQADRISVDVTADNGSIGLAVRDNGRGLPDDWAKRAGQGTRIMQYRAGVLGGTVSLQNLDGKGAAVMCRIPVPAAPHH